MTPRSKSEYLFILYGHRRLTLRSPRNLEAKVHVRDIRSRIVENGGCGTAYGSRRMVLLLHLQWEGFVICIRAAVGF